MWSRLLLTALFALILAVCSQPALAQDAKSQPVARLITSIVPPAISAKASIPVEPNEIERRAFEQTNLVRIRNGLPPFVWDDDICRMARTHSENMSRQGFFSHVTPSGQRLPDRARLVGIIRYSVLA